MNVTVTHLYAGSATVEGLRLATQIAGRAATLTMTPTGSATMVGLDIPSLNLAVADDFLTLGEAEIEAQSLVAQGLVARLGSALELHLSAYSGAVKVARLMDGTRPFTFNDLEIDGTVVKLVSDRPFESWHMELSGDFTGTVDPAGNGTLAVDLDSGFGLPGLSVRLPAKSEKLRPIHIGWRSANLTDAHADVARSFPSETGNLVNVTPRGVHAKVATTAGMSLVTQLGGAWVALWSKDNGRATMYGLDIPTSAPVSTSGHT